MRKTTIFNLGQILAVFQKKCEKAFAPCYDMSYQMDQSETYEPIHTDDLWESACRECVADPVEAGVELLRRGVPEKYSFGAINWIPGECFGIYKNELENGNGSRENPTPVHYCFRF